MYQAIFGGASCIKGQERKSELKEGVSPIFASRRRRSLKEEELEEECMTRLLDLEVLEQSISPWAACNIFVPKEDSCTRVTTVFRALNSVTETHAYAMGDVHKTLE